jgi:hypothetical protein
VAGLGLTVFGVVFTERRSRRRASAEVRAEASWRPEPLTHARVEPRTEREAGELTDGDGDGHSDDPMQLTSSGKPQ